MNLSNLNPDKYFYLWNGEYLKSLEDLREELRKNVSGVNLDNFYHHVSSERNDYVNWIKDVFQDLVLANKVLNSESPSDLFEVIDTKLNSSENKSKSKKLLSSKTKNRVVNNVDLKEFEVSKSSSRKSDVSASESESSSHIGDKDLAKIDGSFESQIVLDKRIEVAAKEEEELEKAFSEAISAGTKFGPVEFLDEKLDACSEFVSLGLIKEAILLFNDIRKHFSVLYLSADKKIEYKNKILDLHNYIKNYNSN